MQKLPKRNTNDAGINYDINLLNYQKYLVFQLQRNFNCDTLFRSKKMTVDFVKRT